MSVSRALFIFTLCVVPTTSQGQLAFLDKVFGNVTDVNAGFVMAELVGSKGVLSSFSHPRGVAIEATIDLGPLWSLQGDQCRVAQHAKKTWIKRDTSGKLKALYDSSHAARGRNDKTVADSLDSLFGKRYDSIYAPGLDTTPSQLRIRREASREIDTTLAYSLAPKLRSPKCDILSAEIGIGYSQLSGFRGDTLGLQGSVEELPSLSFYADLLSKEWVSPYIGLRTGLTQLKAFRATSTADSLIQASGSTWQYGVLAGVSVGPPKGPWALFIEYAFTYRNFDGVAWSGGSASPVLQRTLRPSTKAVTLGGQIAFGSSPSANSP